MEERNQIQALERSQPVLPTGLGYLEGVTHDYYRHGTTTLFAALEVKSSEVITRSKPAPPSPRVPLVPAAPRRQPARHPRSAPRRRQLRDAQIPKSAPSSRRIHVIMSTIRPTILPGSTKSHAGLVASPNNRSRGSFTNVKQLVQRIDAYVTHYNFHPRPLRWAATADSILAKLERLLKVICGTLQLARSNYGCAPKQALCDPIKAQPQPHHRAGHQPAGRLVRVYCHHCECKHAKLK